MRTVSLFYPNLREKQVNNKIAIRDKSQIERLKVIRAGDNNYNFVVSDGQGLKANLKLEQLTKQGALFEIVGFLQDKNFGNFQNIEFNIFLPLIKPARLEEAIQMVTQLDFYSHIYLYFSDFTRYSEKKISENKIKRFKRKVKTSFNQSRSSIYPKIILQEDIKEFIEKDFLKNSKNLFIIPDLEVDNDFCQIDLNQKISFYINALKKKDVDSVLRINLVVGSEGGFSKNEKKFFKNLKNIETYFFKFGDSVLTTECAAVVFSGLIKSEVMKL